MKKFIISALVIVMGLQACQKKENVEKFDEKKADKALLEKYPDAVNIAGRLKNSYSIADFIAQKYSNARIIEIDREKNGIEVDILDGRVKRELLFDFNNKWIYTKTEVRLSEVPEAVLKALNGSEYANYEKDDIEHYLTENKEYYIFDLEKGEIEVEVEIDVQGNLKVLKIEK